MESTGNNKPSILNFAGVMLVLMGFFQLVSAIEFFRSAGWVKELTGGIFGDQLVIWGIIDLVVCLVAFYGAYGIFKGSKSGRWPGMLASSISAVRWFWMIPLSPWMGFIMVFVNVIIIYGIVMNWEYFE